MIGTLTAQVFIFNLPLCEWQVPKRYCTIPTKERGKI